ncbi:MAG: RNA polymerase sigma factor [Planctomycetaceae bacterium]
MTSDADRIDPDDIAAWYQQHAGPLRSFLLGVVRNAELAEEILQITFTRAMEAGHTAREGTQKGWLFRVAYNEAMLLGRKRQLHERSLRKIALRPLPESETPEQRAGLVESAERVRDVLEQLSPEQQAVVRKRIYEDKTFAEIAEELQVPLGTVLTRMRTSLGRLQRWLKEENQ